VQIIDLCAAPDMAQCKYELGTRRQLRNGVYTDGINRTDGNPLAKKVIEVFTTS